MLVVADNLSEFKLGAGEPFLLQVAFQDKNGAAVDISARAFVLSFYKADRSLERQLAGVPDSDGEGQFLRFEEDGNLSESLYGGASLKVELAERYLRGRNVIATGSLTIAATAATVQSLGNGPIGACATRIVVKASATLSAVPVFSQRKVPWVAQGSAPTVTVAAAPTLSLSAPIAQPEGNSGTTAFTYTLTLTRNGSTAAIPFAWAVTGTGANPADAADFGGTFPSGSGTFAAGETSKTITVLATGDTAVEPDEAFQLTVTSPGLASVSANGTIVNDDALPALTLTGPLTYAANAAAGTLVANIGNVPAGVTPTLTPNDGRLVVAGSQQAGWTVVVGMSASSAGTISLSVSAAGATGATAPVTVTAAAAMTASVAGAGDSVMAGQYASNRGAIDRMALGSGVTVLNTGVPGEAAVATLDRVTYGSLNTARSTSKRAIAFWQPGTNDLADNGNSIGANRLYEGGARPGIATLKAQGFYVIICTLLPRKAGVFNWSAAQESERLSYNAKVRTNGAGADYVLDLAAHPVMGDAANNTSNATWYYDGVHPTDAGQDQLASGGQYTYAYAVQQVYASASSPRAYGIEDGKFLRLGALSNMAETGNATDGYSYSATADASYGPSAGLGTGTVSLGSGVVGWYEAVVPAFGTSGPIIGLQQSATFTNFNSINFGMFVDAGGQPNNYAILAAGASVTPNGTAITPQANDHFRIRRAETGTFAEATRDGAVWTKVHSFSGSGFPLYAVAMSPSTAAKAKVLRPRVSKSAA